MGNVSWTFARRALCSALACLGACGGGGGGGGQPTGPYHLDLAFDQDGRVGLGGPMRAVDVATYADGRVLVAANTSTPTTAPLDPVLVRLLANGSPDSTFGVNGVATFDTGGTDYAASVAFDSSGRILLAGLTDGFTAGANYDFFVARFSADGQPDASFGLGGTAHVDFGGNEYLRKVLVQQDGKILLVGDVEDASTLIRHMAVARLDSGGGLDTAYKNVVTPSASDGDGRSLVVFAPPDSDDRAWSAALQPDGKLLLVGTSAVTTASQYNYAVARLGTDGFLDPAFAGGGTTTFALGSQSGAVAVAPAPAGKTWVVGNRVVGFFDVPIVLRLDSAGALDPTFNDVAAPTVDDGDGRRRIEFFNTLASAVSATVESDGSLGLLLHANPSATTGDEQFAVARMLPSGVLDLGFVEPTPSVPGQFNLLTMAQMSNGYDYAAAIAKDAQGRYVLAGTGDRVPPDFPTGEIARFSRE